MPYPPSVRTQSTHREASTCSMAGVRRGREVREVREGGEEGREGREGERKEEEEGGAGEREAERE